MRFVDRAQVSAPASLTAPGGAGALEFAKAQLHYGVPNAPAFGFRAYKTPDVIQALEQLFHRKCAYCESSYAAVHPMDVEHYRPKGGVHEAPGHPGYWWLAADWTNLLPSCIDCNRRRYQDLYVIADVQSNVFGPPDLSGKQNLFPIAGPQYAASAGAALSAEDPLLIDPCRRDPALHLTWASSTATIPGKVLALAVPRELDHTADRYASTSIAIYGLNRSGLVDARTDLIRQLEYELEELRGMIESAADSTGEKLASDLLKIGKKVAHMTASGAGPRPYSACAAEFLTCQLTQLLKEMGTLLAQCRQDAIDQQQ